MPNSTRSDITADLSEKILNRLRRENAIVAEEVWVDPKHRVDFVAFTPGGAPYSEERQGWDAGSIERGTFTFAEVKSCMADFKSGHGLTFTGDSNILVCPRDLADALHSSQQLPANAAVYCPNKGGNLTKVFEGSFYSVRTEPAVTLLWAMVKHSAHLYWPNSSSPVK